MNNLSGQTIGRYHILEQFGQGGMAVVYKAYDTRLERDVAFKLIRTDEIPPSQYDRLMLRFEREAKAQASFNHPNIIPVFDYGQTDGFPYLVMAYIAGGTLKQKTGQLVDLQTALSWLIPIADALAYAHHNGVIHRDIKPSNILFDQSRPMLADFGIAKLLHSEDATLTGTGLGVGTPEYMAPEQWHGKPCEASDQYALGVVLYELITGQKPYTADTPAAIAIIQATEPLKPPSHWVQGIPEAVEKVLFKALAREPQHRYEDMLSFKEALQALSETHSPQTSKPTPTDQPTPILSESETIDVFAPVPDKKSPTPIPLQPSSHHTGKRDQIPRWLIWGGAGLLLILLVAGLIAVFLGGRALQPSLIGSAVEKTAREENDIKRDLTEETSQQEIVEIPLAEATDTEEVIQHSLPQVTQQPTPDEATSITIQPTAELTATPTTEPTPTSKDGATLVYIPAGSFLMGSTEDDLDWALSQSWCSSCQLSWFSDELPQHEVYLNDYWIYQSPVTNQQFGEFVTQTSYQTTAELQGWSWVFNNGSEKVDGVDWRSPQGVGTSLDGKEDHPVVHISYQDASAYCQWVGGRLPTEAEWEKAGRGKDGRTYPWGDILPNCSLANYSGCTGGTLPVDSHPLGASPYDVQDMVGNIWEWTADYYYSAYYSISSNYNPQGPATGDSRVIRGGSWYSNLRYLRVTDRFYSNENDTSNDHGFRCVIP